MNIEPKKVLLQVCKAIRKTTLMDRLLEITDPTFCAEKSKSPYDKICLKLIRDERDLPLVRLVFFLTATFPPAALWLLCHPVFNGWLAVPYLSTLLLVYTGPFTLLLHNSSHRPLFKSGHYLLGGLINWVLGPLFGQTPNTYFAHHIGMHHPENNLRRDLSSTLPYQRDSRVDFARYVGRFMLLGIVDLSLYLKRKNRSRLLMRAMFGELSYFIIVTILLIFNWRATAVVFVIPWVVMRFGMMAGNWAQHAFVDPLAPENYFRNSITCINSSYNHKCFNDGYHIGHHVKSNRHWTEMPIDFQQNLESYRSEGAIVFRRTDFFGIWFALMLKRYNWLAARFVDLGGDTSREAIISLLKYRLQRINLG